MKAHDLILSRFLQPKAMVIALALAVGSFPFGGAAEACSLVEFRDNGRYVGGDLPTQIAVKADTIQIVRVVARHLVYRSYTAGERYLNFGISDVPADFPEYTDGFAFELEPVETLKGGGDPSDSFYEKHLRVRGFGPEAFSVAGRDDRHPSTSLNVLPEWLADRPGNEGYAFIGASADSGLGGGECSAPYVLEVGQTLLALRDNIGRLYPASGAFPLEIDAEFLNGKRQQQRLTLNMQSLIPINAPEDAFVARLRQALAARPNATRN